MVEKLNAYQKEVSDSINGTKYDTEVTNKNLNYKIIKNYNDVGDAIIPVYENLNLSSKSIRLSLESLCFLVHLNGHNKNLLLFLITFQTNSESLLINWDSTIINQYMKFCETTELEVPTIGVVKETIKRLAAKKVITNVKRRLYMLNPILVAGVNVEKKNKMLNEYSKYALKKKKDTHDELFPTIYNLKG
jgi:hypothetical protein